MIMIRMMMMMKVILVMMMIIKMMAFDETPHFQHDEIDRLERLLQCKASDISKLTQAAGSTNHFDITVT